MPRLLWAGFASGLLGLCTHGCVEATPLQGDGNIQYWMELGVSIPDTLIAEVEYPVTVTVQIATVEVSQDGPEDWYEYRGLESPDSAYVIVGFEEGTVDPAEGAADASGVFATVVRADLAGDTAERYADFTFSATVFGHDLSGAIPGSRGGEPHTYQVVVLHPDSIG